MCAATVHPFRVVHRGTGRVTVTPALRALIETAAQRDPHGLFLWLGLLAPQCLGHFLSEDERLAYFTTDQQATIRRQKRDMDAWRPRVKKT